MDTGLLLAQLQALETALRLNSQYYNSRKSVAVSTTLVPADEMIKRLAL